MNEIVSKERANERKVGVQKIDYFNVDKENKVSVCIDYVLLFSF